MAHLAPRRPERAGLFVRLCYWFARRRLGRVPIPVGIMAYNRWVLAAAGSFEMALERAGSVDVRLKELVSIKAAMQVGCRFCIDIGASLARGHGVTEEELMDLPFHESSTRFTPLEKRMLDYAVAMSTTPMHLDKALFDSLRDELGVEALVELTAAIAWENFRARFNHAFGAKEEGYSGNTLCLLNPAPAAQTQEESPLSGAHA